MNRYLAVRADGTLEPVEVRVGSVAPPPQALHDAVHGSYRNRRVWLGRTLLRGTPRGLDRWAPEARSTASPPPPTHPWIPVPGMDGFGVVDLAIGGNTAWATTDSVLYRVTERHDGEPQAEPFFRLGDLPLGNPSIRVHGDFCDIVAIDDERVLLRFRNYGRNDLFVLRRNGARPLDLPATDAHSVVMRPPPVPGPMPPTAPSGGPAGAPSGGPVRGPGGGVTPPRNHQLVRAGDRVFVGGANNRLYVFDPSAEGLIDVTPSNGLPPGSTSSFQASDAAAAPGPEGPALFVLGNRLFTCASGPCQAVASASGRSFAHVVYIEGRAFLAPYVEMQSGRGGAVVISLPDPA